MARIVAMTNAIGVAKLLTLHGQDENAERFQWHRPQTAASDDSTARPAARQRSCKRMRDRFSDDEAFELGVETSSDTASFQRPTGLADGLEVGSLYRPLVRFAQATIASLGLPAAPSSPGALGHFKCDRNAGKRDELFLGTF